MAAHQLSLFHEKHIPSTEAGDDCPLYKTRPVLYKGQSHVALVKVDKTVHKWIKDKQVRHLSLKTVDKLINVSRETTISGFM